jgi:hypothetical protein
LTAAIARGHAEQHRLRALGRCRMAIPRSPKQARGTRIHLRE